MIKISFLEGLVLRKTEAMENYVANIQKNRKKQVFLNVFFEIIVV